ncbi:GH39 family glycosyl hydrolase [Formosa sp. PL04]|uniref:GH39 family glycosyl hydrolase n=1 Tax=Formosa sp. PL04 TaxID=3081755 RepID=UPI002980F9E3|nr:hypothetical protein [Formosa sp. PL04]MDW5288139.1 hypothetical protein [Formosa sp. PL04]
MKKKLLYGLCLFFLTFTQAQVTLFTDFTDGGNKKETLHNIWSVANRISPTNGAGVRPDVDVNLVRMIGGVKKKVNGVNVPDLAFDTVTYDEDTRTYVYNWMPLISRLDNIVNSHTKIHQLVLDQVPWAFQQGYNFIPDGQPYNGIDFKESERITIYGNALPPKDKIAYSEFIKAMMQKLIDTYGEALVLSWRFRVGSEIETPDHWRGTKQDFIDHYANTEKAVRAVLLNATIGVHTRDPEFLYKNGIEKNYKGEPFASFAKELIEYSYDNDVRYDFWGVSDYILINIAKFRDISGKYNKLYAPLLNHPKWNTNATLDLMEYSVVTTMTSPDGGYLTCNTAHTTAMNLAFTHMFYKNEKHRLDGIFRWGQRPNTIDPPSIETVKSMVGKTRYETEILGIPATSTNKLDQYLIKKPDLVSLKSGFDRKGTPSRTLTTASYNAYKNFTDFSAFEFNETKEIITTSRSDGGLGSVVILNTKIGPFEFKKFEFRQESTLEEVQTAYNGAINLPGILEAENYDLG